MHLCTYVSEEGGDGEGAGSEALSLLSQDTHRREVSGAHDTGRNVQVNYAKKKGEISGHVEISALLQQTAQNLYCNLTPERILMGL